MNTLLRAYRKNGFTLKNQKGFADIVAFGRSFLANPDFVSRFEIGAPLNQVDFTTLYTPGEKGYTDYPAITIMDSQYDPAMSISSTI
jgi:2,4-dienoyl-CoA reductase-like NADH-dependent reductase (Old Yellow Enzyme family)